MCLCTIYQKLRMLSNEIHTAQFHYSNYIMYNFRQMVKIIAVLSDLEISVSFINIILFLPLMWRSTLMTYKLFFLNVANISFGFFSPFFFTHEKMAVNFELLIWEPKKYIPFSFFLFCIFTI